MIPTHGSLTLQQMLDADSVLAAAGRLICPGLDPLPSPASALSDPPTKRAFVDLC